PQLIVDRGLQVDDRAGAREAPAGGRIEHRAPAGRDDDASVGRQLGEALALALAEAGLAFLLEDERDVDPGAPLDLRVAVVEAASEGLRELAADGGLAGAHRPDQVEVVAGIQGCARLRRRAHRLSKREGRRNGRPSSAPARAGAGRRGALQLTRVPSLRIRGVTKIRSSALSLIVSRFRNR